MRVKPKPDFKDVDWTRITPAHAGKTGFGKATGWRAQDHPRACG